MDHSDVTDFEWSTHSKSPTSNLVDKEFLIVYDFLSLQFKLTCPGNSINDCRFSSRKSVRNSCIYNFDIKVMSSVQRCVPHTLCGYLYRKVDLDRPSESVLQLASRIYVATLWHRGFHAYWGLPFLEYSKRQTKFFNFILVFQILKCVISVTI